MCRARLPQSPNRSFAPLVASSTFFVSLKHLRRLYTFISCPVTVSCVSPVISFFFCVYMVTRGHAVSVAVWLRSLPLSCIHAEGAILFHFAYFVDFSVMHARVDALL